MAAAAFALAGAPLVGPPLSWAVFRHAPRFAFELTFLSTAAIGGLVYVAALLAALHALGVDLPWPRRFMLRARPA